MSTSVAQDNAPPAVDAAPAGPRWPQPTDAVEILPADASTTMYERWRDERLRGIGGSDIAAVLGLVGWESEFGLWLTKIGMRPPVVETPMMTRGRYGELMLAQWFADETGLALKRTGTWAIPEWDEETGQWVSGWERCNPDRFTSDGGGVEFKMPDTDDWGNLWRYGPAEHAVAQAEWCMAVTGCPHWYVVADGGKDGLRWWRIDRDEQRLRWMVDRVAAWWWRHIVNGDPPDVDGSEATTRACKESSSPAGTLLPRTEVPGCAEWARERRRLKDQMKDLKQDLDLVENRFKAALIGAETATDQGVDVLAWAYRKDQKVRMLKEPKK